MFPLEVPLNETELLIYCNLAKKKLPQEILFLYIKTFCWTLIPAAHFQDSRICPSKQVVIGAVTVSRPIEMKEENDTEHYFHDN